MMKPHQMLAEWSEWFWPLLANHLWQATLFALLAWVAACLFARAPARVRHLVWLMAFVKFLLPSLLLIAALRVFGIDFSWLSFHISGDFGGADFMLRIVEPIAQIGRRDTGGSHNEIYCGLSICWLIGASLILFRWSAQRQRLARILSGGEEVEDGCEVEAFNRARIRLNLTRPVKLVTSSEIAGPVVWGVLRPVIVLPKGLAETLSGRELEAVMAHELIHVKHRDNLFSNLRMLICSLFWFHPLVWLVDRKLADERELICDEQVVAAGNAPEMYAAGLWKVVRFGLGWPLAGASRAAGSNLKWRIESMLNSQHHQTTATNRVAAACTLFVLIVFVLSMAVFSRDTARASESQEKKGEQSEKQNDDSIQPMDPSTRPIILYQEKAEYTKEAKDNKVEGTVILSLVFGADAKLSDIKVVRELPDGLTEKAIEAAQTIRFKPAEKDGKPVSVRGKLEYTFRLE